MKFYSKKIIELKTATIHLHYANNAGRGDNNVTITVVAPGTNRHALTRLYDSYYYRDLVSGWRGNVNVPTWIINKYGGLKPQPNKED